jgi:hypothetical protein
MSSHFEHDGISFQYPENWKLEREDSESGWTVTLQSPTTAFLLLCYDEDMPTIEEVLQTTVEALRSDYEDLELEDEVENIAGQPAVGYDIQFTSLDLTNTCWLRTFQTDDATILLMWQATDLDMDEAEPVLRAICASMELAEE